MMPMPKRMRGQVNPHNASIAKRSNYTVVIKKIDGMAMCPFCEENILIHHPKPLLFKNAHWIVTENAWPYSGAKHHFLLICRDHVSRTEDTTPQVWSDLQTAYKKLVKKYRLSGSTLFIRSGNTNYTGATVQHLHAQVIAGTVRKKDSSPILAIVGFQTKKNSSTQKQTRK